MYPLLQPKGTDQMESNRESQQISRDQARQWANVILAVGQIVATGVSIASGGSEQFSSNTVDTTTPVVPAGYAFAVWGLIYGGSVAYAFYQLRETKRRDPLLRRIGWYTAAAFLSTILWLAAASTGRLWLTVVCIFAILIALLGAFVGLIAYRAPRDRAERWLVVLPISVFLGWATVACVANTSTTLQTAGFSNVLLPDQAWAVLMLVVASGIAAFVTAVSRGNIFYALTIIWALIGVVIANIAREPNLLVAVTAGAGAGIIALVLARSRAEGNITPHDAPGGASA
jgi:hypothetical protein